MTLFGTPDHERAGGGNPSCEGSELVRVRMKVAYEGAGFHGFSAQPGQDTVAGRLAEAISTFVGHPVQLTCAGRTDTGVHASGQVVHVDVRLAGLCGGGSQGDTASGVERLASACNRMLSPRIVVREAGAVPFWFDARRSALSRRYVYTVLNSAVPHPFLARTAWLVSPPLDVGAMRAAADPFIGEHDFGAFCRRSGDNSLVRRVLDASWRVEHLDGEWGAACSPEPGGARRSPVPGRIAGREGPGSAVEARLLRFDIEASSFCHQMVRSLVGTMVEVGKGRMRAGDMSYILRAKDRSLAASPAPPHGLCLVAVTYPPESDAG